MMLLIVIDIDQLIDFGPTVKKRHLPSLKHLPDTCREETNGPRLIFLKVTPTNPQSGNISKALKVDFVTSRS